MMLQGLVFGVIVFFADVSMSTMLQYDHEIDLNDHDFITENQANTEIRAKRALLPSIVGKLFDGAKLLKNTRDYELYSKPGGFSQAKADFESLVLKGVTNTRMFAFRSVAQAGDRTVILTGNGRTGTIDVWKNQVKPDGTRRPYKFKTIYYIN